MAYIGKIVEETELANRTVDTMTGDGSDITLSLSATPISVNNVLIFFDGVMQRPTTDFTLAGSVITFTTAPENAVKVIAISGGGEHIGVPSAKLSTDDFADGAVTNEKIGGITASKLTGALPALDGTALTNINAINNITTSTIDPIVSENPSAGQVWANTTTGEMYVCTDATTGANVWTNVGDGTGNISPALLSLASGGTLTTDGDYNVHTFNSSSQLIFSVADAPVEYLVIAGGGTGYRIQSQGGGGGGGAGGYRTATDLGVTAQSYTVTVGAGGAAPAANAGNNGNNSTFSTITSTGGGKGGLYSAAAASGGSGGGTRSNTSDASAEPAGAGNAGGYSPVEGYAGASGQNIGPYQGAGGGGGASEAGTVGSGSSGGAGGDGRASSITGSSITRAGGGGGSVYSSGTHGAGGAGGGTDGTHTETLSAAVNTGSGSGGSERSGAGYPVVGSGGSGVVIIRYLAR